MAEIQFNRINAQQVGHTMKKRDAKMREWWKVELFLRKFINLAMIFDLDSNDLRMDVAIISNGKDDRN